MILNSGTCNIPTMTLFSILQQTNGDVSPDPRNDSNIYLQIKLDVNLQASLNILFEVIEAKACIFILVLLGLIAGRGFGFGLAAGLNGTDGARGSFGQRASTIECVAYATIISIAFRITRCVVGCSVKESVNEIQLEESTVPFCIVHFGGDSG
jgi:hypothetical protein